MFGLKPHGLIGYLVLTAAFVMCCWAQEASRPVARTIEVGGHRIQVAEAGSAKVLVVFVSGLGEDWHTWDKVQPRVAGFARTISYDRAGIGGSDGVSGPRDVAVLVDELRQTLYRAGHSPPFVLVGHSLGGAVIAEFARAHSDEVAGLVFVDPEDQRLLDRLEQQLPAGLWQERQAALARAMPSVPPAAQAELRGMAESRHSAGLLQTELPITLLTGTLKNPQFPGNPLEQDLKLEIHRSDLRQMQRALHLLVPESRHYIQNDAPDTVVTAIRDLVASLR